MTVKRSGTIRDNELNKTLISDSFQIDQRSFGDIMGYMCSYLENINFFDIENKVDGDWKKLIKTDPIISMVLIINAPLPNFKDLEKDTTGTNTPSTIDKIDYLSEWYNKINEWQITLNNLGENKLANKISNVLTDVLGYSSKILILHKQQLNFEQNINNDKYNIPPSPIPSSKIDINESINTFQKVIIHIQKFTKDYLEQNILSKNNHMPNNAINIAFVILYKRIQDNLNTLSKRHLDFYYKDILQQQKSKGKPTKTIINFDLLPTVQYSLIDKGAQLTAGKLFGSKTDIIFQTDKPIVAYQMELVELKTLLFNSSPYINVGTNEPLISSISKNNLIIKGKEIGSKEEWFVFGANKQTLQTTQIVANKVADLGFIIGSSVLFLSEGKREIEIQVNMESTSSKSIFWELLNQIKSNRKIGMDIVVSEVFGQSMKISYTTKKAWVKFDNYSVDYNEKDNYFTINLVLGNSDLALSPSLKIKEKLKWPSIKVELNEYAPTFLYSFWKGLIIDTIDINVNVERIRNLSLYNNIGNMPLNKSFDLFGPFPKVGSFLMIGKSELFQKQLTSVEIDFEWDSIPLDFGGFDTYYEKYQENINNNSFKVQVTALSNSFWIPSKLDNAPTLDLFSTHKDITPEGYQSVQLDSTRTIDIKELNEFEISPDFNLKDPLKYTVSSQSGFLKITLVSPSYGFGSELYQKVFTKIAMYNAKNKDTLPFPNTPFVPKVKSVSVNYKASDTLIFNEEISTTTILTESAGEFMHITPFGIEEALTNLNVRKRTLVCDFEQEGYLYIGLNGIKNNTTVSMFFHFLQSSAENNIIKDELLWEYFQIKRWVKFEDGNIIMDNTNGFVKSGIIEFLLPKVSGTEVNESSETYWIRVSTKRNVAFYPIIKGIYLNAVEAVCTCENDLIVGREIPQGSIKKFAGKFADVKKVNQPIASSGGILEEDENEFYSCVSERLRHKDRALSIWDYEHIILKNFKDVRVVKCTNLNKLFNQVSGKIKVIVLSTDWSINEKHYFDEEKLFQMKTTLQKISNPFIDIQVINPTVEYLLTNCIVEFEPEDNGGYYLNLLNTNISDFLSPISSTDDSLGGSVVPSMLISFLEELSFIKSVKKLSIEHIIQEGVNEYLLGIYKDGEKISASTPWSILSPVKKHHIVNLVNDDQPSDLLKVGIGNMEIGLDFILEKKIYEAPENKLFLTNTSKERSEQNLPNDAVLILKNKI